MPIVSVKMAKGRSLEQKRKLTKAITDSLVSVLDVRPEWVSVLIEEYERDNWSTGGELHIDKFGPGCGKQAK
ncbi:4-oxalocrotonate tautomerase [Desulfonema ishimotonii]|uniref:Tautomerase n=1 Tax=Desulfonema ishimotonii TaxID=45657 RepID=A0A401FR93_9BACT|nr:2-hydroxymuconate tautomerase family protein [Desulfonema ishimotonii]GBC59480.1 4-oxalocrotonate tautomerase [Desulfonema ishimotonii]